MAAVNEMTNASASSKRRRAYLAAVIFIIAVGVFFVVASWSGRNYGYSSLHSANVTDVERLLLRIMASDAGIMGRGRFGREMRQYGDDSKMGEFFGGDHLDVKEETEEPIGADTTFLLGIFSTLSAKENQRRHLIRETYLTQGGGRICSLIQYTALHPKDRINCTVAYTFVVGANPDGPSERFETDGEPITLGPKALTGLVREPDIVYLNIKENMEHGKTPTWFRYGSMISQELGVHYVGKVDSDSLISIETFLRFVRTELPPAPYNRLKYGGRQLINYLQGGMYMAGELYFASSDLAQYVTNSDPIFLERRRKISVGVEDMDFGSWVYTHPQPVRHVLLSRNMFWFHPLKEESEWKIIWDGLDGGDDPQWEKEGGGEVPSQGEVGKLAKLRSPYCYNKPNLDMPPWIKLVNDLISFRLI